MHIRVGDLVEVIAGADRRGADGAPTRARVLQVVEGRRKVIVEGVNRVYKLVRPSQRNPQGGRLSKEMPIDISNVKLVCPECNQATRTGARFLEDGSKERYCKKCGKGIGQISPPKPSRARRVNK